jgi:hypothetical protein
MLPGPTDLQIELFRTVEDIHDMTGAIAVLIVGEDGESLAVSGDELDIPAPVRAVLAGKKLEAAGSARELLSTVAGDLAGSPMNLTIYAIDARHVLCIAFGSDADLSTVQSVGNEARVMLAELFRAPSSLPS